MPSPFYRRRGPRRRFRLRRSWKEIAGAWFSQGLTPHELALTVAAGSACAFFPVLGAATPLCVAAAAALRLNQALVQGVNALTAPLYPAAVLLFVRFGEILSGAPARGLDWRAWSTLLKTHPGDFLGRFGDTLTHAIIGWAITCVFAVPAAYGLSRLGLGWANAVIRARRQAAEGAAA